ncbi:MAG: integrating conjugative element protein [Salinisphaera sp.]|jgi:hypothetical protein|nr:integrating conjugative element protein [Salinisphaera sp.]
MSRSVRLSFCRALLAIATCLAIAPWAAHAASNNLYYQLGGGSPVSVSAGAGHQPGNLGLGIRWNQGSACSGLNPQVSVANQLNGVTNGFHNLMGSVIQNATAAVGALPAMIIQRAAPGLYDLLTNGVLQGKLNFNRAKTSCQAMARRAAGVLTSGSWRQQAESENWEQQAAINPDAVAAQHTVETSGGNNGVTWVGGQKRGGAGQAPIQVTHDTAIAGYNLLLGRSNPNSTAPVAGGGGGWGSIPGGAGSWPGAGSGSGAGSGAPLGPGCDGGMCTVWGSPTTAAQWITTVIGNRSIRTCAGCDKMQSQAGTGLMRALAQEQKQIQQKLTAMVDGSQPVTAANLRAVSGGPGLSISAGVIKALANDPKGALLTHRLAGEMALSRTLTQAIWARRVMLAGASDPGIAGNSQGQQAINGELTQLDRGINGLRTEMDVRRDLAHNAAQVSLIRQQARSDANQASHTQPGTTELNSRNPLP